MIPGGLKPLPPPKDPKRQLQGRRSRTKGKQFEELIDRSLDYYRERGFADIEKTPEPMKVVRRLDHGRFVACFEKKAQPDYKGLIKGGREILFEAKYTDADRIEQDRVGELQAKYMSRHQSLGARCYVLAGFGTGTVYKVPWDVWQNMKSHFGHKYVAERDKVAFPFINLSVSCLLKFSSNSKGILSGGRGCRNNFCSNRNLFRTHGNGCAKGHKAESFRCLLRGCQWLLQHPLLILRQ